MADIPTIKVLLMRAQMKREIEDEKEKAVEWWEKHLNSNEDIGLTEEERNALKEYLQELRNGQREK